MVGVEAAGELLARLKFVVHHREVVGVEDVTQLLSDRVHPGSWRSFGTVLTVTFSMWLAHRQRFYLYRSG